MRYVNEFLSLKCAPDVLATVGYLGNKPDKEITEAYAIIKKLKKIVLNEPNKYELIDLCSGNALVPIIAAHLLPINYSYAVDKKPRDRNWSNTLRFQYILEDIYNFNIGIKRSPTPSFILTSVHCCKNLAERAIELYNRTEEVKHLILMPCCIGNLDTSLLRFIKKEANDDLAWVTKLATQCKGDVHVSKDNFVMSPKRYVIHASKTKVITSEDTIDKPEIQDIPTHFIEEFSDWMWGQTCAGVNGRTVIYSWIGNDFID